MTQEITMTRKWCEKKQIYAPNLEILTVIADKIEITVNKFSKFS